jgi:hypothetical protein
LTSGSDRAITIAVRQTTPSAAEMTTAGFCPGARCAALSVRAISCMRAITSSISTTI